MKTVRHLLTGVALVLALVVLGTDGASAAQLYGKVKQLTTHHGVGPQLSVRVNSTSCDGDETVTERFVSIHASVPTDDSAVTMKIIHSTLLAALLSDRPVYFQTQTPCDLQNLIDLTTPLQGVGHLIALQ